MLRDNKNETRRLTLAEHWSRLSVPKWAEKYRSNWRDLGLPSKLLMLTGVFVLLAEVLIFLPSVSTFRVDWLNERLTAAQLATLAAEGFPGGDVPSGLRAEMLRTAQVKAIASRRQGVRRLVLPVDPQMTIDAHYDLRQVPETVWESIGLRLEQIGDAIAVFFARDNRTIRVLGSIGDDPDDLVEIVMPEAPLKAALRSYALNILGVSIVISLATAALVYFALSRLLVRPMMRITRAMVQFRQDPEDPARIIVPSSRHDEIGVAERELGEMQRQLSGALLQKTRLAQLGLAVSKINHDLRGMLANAQLLSDRLTAIPDPTVQRFAPKLIASLDRAINFCNDTLRFGRAEEAPPRRELLPLKPLVEEVGEALGLPREGSLDWVLDIDDTLRIDADRDHLFRILSQPRAQCDRSHRRRPRRAARRDPRAGLARRPARARRGARQRPRRAAEGARAPVRGVHRLAAQGRHRSRAGHRRRDRRRARRPCAATRHAEGRRVPVRHPRSRRASRAR